MEGRMNRLQNSSLAATPATTLGHSKRFIAAAQTKLDAPVVYIGGDIPGAAEVIQEAGWRVRKLDSLDDLFHGAEPETASCLLIDLAWSSLENRALQQRLAGLGAQIPFICTAQEVNLALVVAIMKTGALDVLGRPVIDETLLGAIQLGLQNSEAALQEAKESRQLRDRYETLRRRERQVMALAASGLLNKQIAAELGISEITVKAHRGSAMRKMEARSFAGLVKMAMALGL
jgi:FixJ family two-component response regulator